MIRDAYVDRSIIVKLIPSPRFARHKTSWARIQSQRALAPSFVATTRLDRALPLGLAINPRPRFNLTDSKLLFIVTRARYGRLEPSMQHFIGIYLVTIIELVN